MNAILIVIDSLDFIVTQKSSEDLLPFLHKEASSGLICENIYSQAPYTEAAAMALYCGQDTLSNHGYIERYNNAPNTIFEVMNQNGYEVYYNAYQPQSFPSSLIRGATSIRYNRGFDFIGFWNYRLSYYSDLYKEGLLNEKDYIQLTRLFDDNFSEWIRFLDDLLESKPSVQMIKDRDKGFDPQKEKMRVMKESEKYRLYKKAYIEDVLKLGKKHILFEIDQFDQNYLSVPTDVQKVFSTKGKNIAQRLCLKSFFSNMLFNRDIHLKWMKALYNYIKKCNQSELRLMKNVILVPFAKCGCGSKMALIKEQPSFRTHTNNFLDWLDERDCSKPYFACIHVDDIHFPETYYTYDSKNAQLLKEEYAYIDEYLKRRKLNVPGSPLTEASLLYADFQCKYLVQRLKDKGEYQNTNIFVTADHGFSYYGYPIREKPVNTFYLENFKIPFFAFGGNIKAKHTFELFSSVDIPKTICACMEIDSDRQFTGVDIYRENREYLTIEYCGGGCPDLLRRKIMLAAFDQNRFISVKLGLYEEFSLDKVVEVYNLKKDPDQRKNLISSYAIKEYEDLLQHLKARFLAIQKDEQNFWNQVEL